MNLKDCYLKFGGDFDEVLGRLRREQTVRKFVFKFLEKKDYSEALRAVHTLKGICQNLSFTRLFESSSLTTTALKQNDWNKAVDMMPQLSNDYYEIVDIIRAYKNSGEE